ncbi:hypothetical protein HMI54_000506 [Coelomomyces lativittatus]|nr:hypothetical protein HMI55_005511 [Coelomomyces lativittatus]KAJ1499866.1 hypothetical protein HMI56_004163 [Coelomomyces lativittatus]KAJ1511791.1 hypothetical protein HMI54_000506 [Coelomomyces lativittatus]
MKISLFDLNSTEEAQSKFSIISEAYLTLRNLSEIPSSSKQTSFTAPRKHPKPILHFYPGKIPFNFEVHQYEHYEKFEYYQRSRRKAKLEDREKFNEVNKNASKINPNIDMTLFIGWVVVITIPLILILRG